MKLLIQGCGYIGEVHLNTIRKFNLCDVALCEMNEKRLLEMAARYSITEIYTSFDEALKHQFDGVVVCTPNFAHKGDVEKCIMSGLNVMVEKPMSDSMESAKEIVDLCEKYGRFVFVAYCLRFAGTYQKIKEFIDSGVLGKVFSIRASVAGKKAITDAKTNYRTKKSMGGGVISDFSHEIDYSLWFAGKSVKKVMCCATRAIHKDWDVYDTAEIIMNCEGDVNLSIHMDFLQPYFGRSIEVYGTKGAIRWRDNEMLKLYLEDKGEWQDVDATINWDNVYRDEILHYIDCIKSGRLPKINAKAGYELMKVIDACEKDAEKNEK